jgi:hypothetical protein
MHKISTAENITINENDCSENLEESIGKDLKNGSGKTEKQGDGGPYGRGSDHRDKAMPNGKPGQFGNRV